MHEATVVGIIGGQGWMGRSLGLSLLEQGILPPEQLIVSSRSVNAEVYRDWPEVRCVRDNHGLVERSDIIVLSVRPQDLASLDIAVGDKLVVSLLAMTSCQALAQQIGSRRLVRAMPNAAAEIRRAYFPWFATPEVGGADRRFVQALLESCGMAREVSAERDLDYLTALSGAGPAYPALLAQSLLDHARQNGIADDMAREAVMQTLVGGCLLLERLETDPGEMVERLIAYDGTTAKGLQTMIDEGMERVVHRGLEAAYAAARAPGKA
ncbi:pyrroline-5-carboxylate reductase family protein [Onishia niordana]|uniref:pyrroline-5-carboxylate reductase family protein n=1 Tax=Onishia niordana TaxID=2508711 RepID=UPI00109F77E5|nr:pyrroline-5-carboxylate reductase dimerization domain-containing protein [Halomonas niordiana]